MSKAVDFIEKYTKNCSNLTHLEDAKGNTWEENTPWLTPEQALRAVEIAKDELMENVCQFIQKHHHEYTSWNIEEYELEFNTEQFIQNIKQAMKDE